jgi:GrpB-like predicted nucleotidyltransferase (UPF0157 family)
MTTPVLVVEYDPAWPELFEVLRRRLAAALGNLPHAIEHVGSTAVPGLAAKPIVDLDVAVHSAADVPIAIRRLQTVGYVPEGDLGVPGREAFLPPTDLPYHHLYLCTAGTPAYRRHLLFRDYLRAHPEAAEAYAALKRTSAVRFREDRAAYTAAKSAFIEEILRRAGLCSSPTPS